MNETEASPEQSPTGAQARLAAYLRDHHALVTSSMTLATRTVRENIGTDYEAPLRSVLEDTGHDLVALGALMATVDVEPSRVRLALTRAGGVLGQLKFNGSLSMAYSPSSRVLEIEGLAMLAQGRLGLWQTVQTALADVELPDEIDIAEVQRRGSDQLELLRELHVRATGEAFTDASS